MDYYKKNRPKLTLDDEALGKLRPGQRGAVYAMRGWATATDDSIAVLSLPTGYGKSELIALAPFLFGSRRALIVAPSVVVRSQLANRVRNLQYPREAGIVPIKVLQPKVKEHVGRITTAADWDELKKYDAVVSTPQSISPLLSEVVAPSDPELFDLLIFDEAHHLGAASWVELRRAFPSAAAIGLTATPYRRDRRTLHGRTIFHYPIEKAVDEGFFVPITYREVAAGSTSLERDTAVALAAIKELRQRDRSAGSKAARLLVRANTVERAHELTRLYQELDPEVVLEVVTHEMSRRALADATARLVAGERSGVAFVGVLGEGFDLPSLKIAAYHNPHRSLPVTIQFAGRVARSEGGGKTKSKEPEGAVLIATANDHPEIVAELHQDGQRWDRLIPALSGDLANGSTKGWAATIAAAEVMSETFTMENFRTFMLADIYRLKEMPSEDVLKERLLTLQVASAERDEPADEGNRPRDVAKCVSVIGADNCLAALLARERPLPWLEVTPNGQSEYEYMVLALEPNATDGTTWLCVRSTLPAELTSSALTELFGQDLDRPSRSVVAQYRKDQWTRSRFIGLGKRAVHPVVAGVVSYETGAGRNVDRAVTLDDRVLKELGHAIGITGVDGERDERTQIGIALDKRRVWQTGYVQLPDYSLWVAGVCRELEGAAEASVIGGLRVADSPLDDDAQPVVAQPSPSFDVDWDARYSLPGETPVLFADIDLEVQRRPRAGDIELHLSHEGKVLSTIRYSPQGALLAAPGTLLRRGRSVTLVDALRAHPMSIFFNDGSVMRGPGGCIRSPDGDTYFPIGADPAMVSDIPRATSSANRFLVLDDASSVLLEKNGKSRTNILSPLSSVTTATTPGSLFQLACLLAVQEGADFIFCDDGAHEIADFIIGWRSHPSTRTPRLRLVHCKAMSSAARKGLRSGSTGVSGSGLKDAEEVCQQAIRSVTYLHMTAEAMRKRLDDRSSDEPKRLVRGTLDDFSDILRNDPLSRTSEVWIIHPGLSRGRLRSARGAQLLTLLSAVRVRAVDARADLALIGRA